jgi:hypothetical protein
MTLELLEYKNIGPIVLNVKYLARPEKNQVVNLVVHGVHVRL